MSNKDFLHVFFFFGLFLRRYECSLIQWSKLSKIIVVIFKGYNELVA